MRSDCRRGKNPSTANTYTSDILSTCVSKLCYHLFCRQDIAKNFIVKENISLILIIMINKLKHARQVSIQFIQAVKLYDSNSILFITVLNLLLTDYQDISLSIELLKEICQTNFVTAQADNADAKKMITFIIDMVKFDPHTIRTHIDQIIDLFTVEKNNLRKCGKTVNPIVALDKLISSTKNLQAKIKNK
ncbi:unnamed protein product [Rotaria sp. Silwood2]|nr:unnamed protein product [Rotaria sp. Silwood2]